MGSLACLSPLEKFSQGRNLHPTSAKVVLQNNLNKSLWKKKGAPFVNIWEAVEFELYLHFLFTEKPVKPEDYSDDVQVGKSILDACFFT